jgi:MoaA/NifB/PqqE/SkfB family radical SAM enzyme
MFIKNKTPSTTMIHESKINKYRANRSTTEYGGCFMCDGLFVKADNTLGCSCQVGYYANLGNIADINVGELVNGPLISYIRESFRSGQEPFDMCRTCLSRSIDYPEKYDDRNISLHIEPSNHCNLYCEVCTCTDERISVNTPQRLNLNYQPYEKMMRELKEANLKVKRLAFVGYGEPLFNSELPNMIKFGRQLFPASYIFVDTNANFGPRRAEEIANCGLNEIRIGLDGSNQESYELYRKNGNFTKALDFIRKLAEEVRQTNSTTKIVWKYILFNTNDTDEEIQEAKEYANEIGVELQFDTTIGEWGSLRTKEEIKKSVGEYEIKFNLDSSMDNKLLNKIRNYKRRSFINNFLKKLILK